MINTDRIYFWPYCLLLSSLMFAPKQIPFLDEAALACFVALAAIDILYNKCWLKYAVFFKVSTVLVLYLVFTLLFRDYNIFKAVFNDFLFHMKPVIAFGITYAMAPKFTALERHILRVLCVVLCITGAVVYYLSWVLFNEIFRGPYYYGCLVFCSALIFLMTSDYDTIRTLKHNVLKVAALILIGFICGRSKYFGSAVVVLFMLFLYTPNIVSNISFKRICTLAVALAAILLLTWEKIDYYFISGGNVDDFFNEDSIPTFARAALYATCVLVFLDHPIFGSGYASFASYSSSSDLNYSNLYQEYGLDKIWGLSEDFGSFIADTFYPELTQFGLIGIILFIYAAYWLYRRLRIVHRIKGIVPFSIGTIILLSLAIDSVASCGMVNMFGENLFVILAITLASVKHIDNEEAKRLLKQPLPNAATIWNMNYNDLRKFDIWKKTPTI